MKKNEPLSAEKKYATATDYVTWGGEAGIGVAKRYLEFIKTAPLAEVGPYLIAIIQSAYESAEGFQKNGALEPAATVYFTSFLKTAIAQMQNPNSVIEIKVTIK